MKETKGFSLVELMIVVVIIILLTSMAIPVFEKVQKDSIKRKDERPQQTEEVPEWVDEFKEKIDRIQIGMDKTDFQIMIGKPDDISISLEKDTKMEIMKYGEVKVIFVNDELYKLTF